MPKKPAAKKKPAPKSAHEGGMWKVLEMKKARQKQLDQAQRDGHQRPGVNPAIQPFARNTRFTKFAGPRRKVG